ncbi:MAG: DUF1801 domain-containing protein [Alcanivoracaceae bacterium]|nr:DUF1801 domain-containing protein [Alcanivoracaceae bacterium]
MRLKDKKVTEFLEQLPEERQNAFQQLRTIIVENLPEGFVENINNGMINYVIPLSIYPDGYHCTINTPLPFASIASQKNFMSLHHMGLYANKELLKWFQKEYPKYSKYKLNMGKSCVRFKKIEAIPYEVIGLLMAKVTVADYIQTYEEAIKK